MSRPIWQLLLASADNCEAQLSCRECFDLVAYLAEMGNEMLDAATLLPVVRRHLACCPECSGYFQSRLQEMEAAAGMTNP